MLSAAATDLVAVAAASSSSPSWSPSSPTRRRPRRRDSSDEDGGVCRRRRLSSDASSVATIVSTDSSAHFSPARTSSSMSRRRWRPLKRAQQPPQEEEEDTAARHQKQSQSDRDHGKATSVSAASAAAAAAAATPVGRATTRQQNPLLESPTDTTVTRDDDDFISFDDGQDGDYNNVGGDHDMTATVSSQSSLLERNLRLESLIGQMEQDMAAVSRERMLLKNRCMIQSHEVETSRMTISELECQLDCFCMEIESLKKDGRRLAQENQDLKRRLEAEIKLLERHKSDWTEKEQSMLEQLKALRAENKSTKSLTVLMETKLDSVTSENNRSCMALDEARAEIRAMEKHMSELAAMCEKHQAAARDAESRLQAETIRVHELTTERDGLANLTSSLMEEAESYQLLLEQRIARGDFIVDMTSPPESTVDDASSEAAGGDADPPKEECSSAADAIGGLVGGDSFPSSGRSSLSLPPIPAGEDGVTHTPNAGSAAPSVKESPPRKRIEALQEEIKALNMFIAKLVERVQQMDDEQRPRGSNLRRGSMKFGGVVVAGGGGGGGGGRGASSAAAKGNNNSGQLASANAASATAPSGVRRPWYQLGSVQRQDQQQQQTATPAGTGHDSSLPRHSIGRLSRRQSANSLQSTASSSLPSPHGLAGSASHFEDASMQRLNTSSAIAHRSLNSNIGGGSEIPTPALSPASGIAGAMNVSSLPSPVTPTYPDAVTGNTTATAAPPAMLSPSLLESIVSEKISRQLSLGGEDVSGNSVSLPGNILSSSSTMAPSPAAGDGGDAMRSLNTPSPTTPTSTSTASKLLSSIRGMFSKGRGGGHAMTSKPGPTTTMAATMTIGATTASPRQSISIGGSGGSGGRGGGGGVSSVRLSRSRSFDWSSRLSLSSMSGAGSARSSHCGLDEKIPVNLVSGSMSSSSATSSAASSLSKATGGGGGGGGGGSNRAAGVRRATSIPSLLSVFAPPTTATATAGGSSPTNLSGVDEDRRRRSKVNRSVVVVGENCPSAFG